MSQHMDHVGRKSLPHNVPLWIDPSREIYFINVNCVPRGTNHLCHDELAAKIFETVRWRNENQIWFSHIFQLMPDHVHALMSFPPGQNTIKEVVGLWKRWTARHLKISWQREFFEHRLRNDENWRQKADYILENPVRAGLATEACEWKYVWFPRQ